MGVNYRSEGDAPVSEHPDDPFLMSRTIPKLQAIYEELLCTIEYAKLEKDLYARVWALARLELVGQILDQRYQQLLKDAQ